MSSRNSSKNADWTAFWKRLPFKSLKLLNLYERARFRTYKKLLSRIVFRDFVDLGGGSGTAAKLLSHKYKVPGTVVDNNKEAYKLYRMLGVSSWIKYVRKNLFSYKKKHDLVISDGLIEHFSAQERKKLLKHHKKLANNYVLIFVPKKSWYVLTFMRFKHGPEEHYTRARLLKEVKAAGLKPLHVASDFHMHGVLCTT